MTKLMASLLLGLIALGAGMVWANLPLDPLASGARVDLVVVRKSERKLTLFTGDVALKSYTVALGGAPVGPKEREGDQKTPEGRYSIDGRIQESRFHRALHISYPDARDRDRAGRMCVSPGGKIMIHGITNGLGWIGRFHRFVDWTAGCIAVTDPEIEEIWKAVPNGTPIEIQP